MKVDRVSVDDKDQVRVHHIGGELFTGENHRGTMIHYALEAQ